MLAKLALSQLSAQDSKSICLKGPKAGGKWHQRGSSLTEDGWELADLGDGQILCGHILLILKAMYTAGPWHPCHVLCGIALIIEPFWRCYSPLSFLVPVKNFAGLTTASERSGTTDSSLVLVLSCAPVTAGFEFCSQRSFLDGRVWKEIILSLYKRGDISSFYWI